MKEGYSKKALGELGEDLACRYLSEEGLRIIKRNYRCPKGEIDIVAKDGEMLVFVEVRLRTSGFRGYAEESIVQKKSLRLKRVAEFYLVDNGYTFWPDLRFDLIAINWEGSEPKINWIKNCI